MRTRMLELLLVLVGAIGAMAMGAASASAYVFSNATQAACPACVTPAGQSAAAEIAAGLSINGPQSTTYGSTLQLVDDAKLVGGAASNGATDVAVSLLRSSVPQAFGASPLATGGLVVGAFATGYVVGTAGRAVYLRLTGGSGPGQGNGAVVGDVPWSNARWVLCTEHPSCVTTVYSSAWESPAIPTGHIYARFDSTWPNQNFSVTGVSTYIDCYGSTPPAPPCRPYYLGSSGPPAGALPGGRPITVYTFGLAERPGHVFVRTIQQLVDRGHPHGVIDSGKVSGTRFGSVPPSTPSTDEALGAIDDAIAGNEDFGGFVESQVQTHWPTIPDCDAMSKAACETTLRGAGFHGTLTVHTLTASEAIMARAPDTVTGTSPSGLTKVDPGTTIAIYVNPAVKPSPTPRQRLIADALKANNPGVITDTNKDDIARACERRVTAAGSGRSISDCMTPGLPMYLIGREWPQAADHTIQALASYPPWVLLTYAERNRTSWYIAYPETGKTTGTCEGKYRISNPAATACDEWPWQTTEQGGETPATGHRPHLKIINARQNSASGSRYNTFLNYCGVKLAKAAPTPANGGGRFLVIPLPSWMPQSFMSQNLCNGPASASS